MTDRMRKVPGAEYSDRKKSATWLYWVNAAAFLFGALFWGYLLFGWGRGLWLSHPAEKYGLLLLMFLSSLLCMVKSLRRLADPKENVWLWPYILLALSCVNVLAALVLALLFPALFG
jgi:hypothetical protein